MNIKELKEIIRLVAEKEFAEFELEQPDFKLRIRRNAPPVIHTVESSAARVVHSPPVNEPIPVPSTPVVSTVEAAPAVEDEKAYHIIRSPIVGTFYRAPNPTASPFVEIGDHVEPGTVLCIIEAMKLMNEITSDVAGEVVKIYVENGHPVEYGQPLFAIKPNTRA
ncbi:MAG: acetyl-CoA carboxylase biotin carboxyl carrier protein [Blastocatellia bacterium]|nr:acetyl-CoA carboxylase biotin carboxyl carrier protein [Blastocatellia bacterium]MCS7157513.1 acetyl-CoA carboxylase biotin carboxyl carrier protein [Blastocatellia bacterium]MCX7752686.1 acetyl-CoA carboxylase biotin carboxyl carrier protein [Blastocatellia bacterium]MDW8168417.1 acetyl-CoA carboxylase biotin carboxyl carrier protein [Acidobacteriota bacterium]MDW8255613.1 acetyl-CoA carboxylase biotin carboxyl carrier protein [Acidobacteriota bacterium]